VELRPSGPIDSEDYLALAHIPVTLTGSLTTWDCRRHTLQFLSNRSFRSSKYLVQLHGPIASTHTAAGSKSPRFRPPILAEGDFKGPFEESEGIGYYVPFRIEGQCP
jgi:hypothetical protein